MIGLLPTVSLLNLRRFSIMCDWESITSWLWETTVLIMLLIVYVVIPFFAAYDMYSAPATMTVGGETAIVQTID